MGIQHETAKFMESAQSGPGIRLAVPLLCRTKSTDLDGAGLASTVTGSRMPLQGPQAQRQTVQGAVGVGIGP